MLSPVYLAYCVANGKTPNEMMVVDKEKYPGGCMCGFQLWVREQKREFLAEYPEYDAFGYISDLKAWNDYLINKFKGVLFTDCRLKN